MEKQILQQVDEIRKRMKCSKGFYCAESGFEKLCKAKDIGLKNHLLCLENASAACDFSLLLEKEYYCACPLRVYLTKNLQRDAISKAEAV
jgi:hypothetical protein